MLPNVASRSSVKKRFPSGSPSRAAEDAKMWMEWKHDFRATVITVNRSMSRSAGSRLYSHGGVTLRSTTSHWLHASSASDLWGQPSATCDQLRVVITYTRGAGQGEARWCAAPPLPSPLAEPQSVTC
ncbi:hypothetical protein RRG08_008687 [Elysia crispata]|uniref:Uncharacterized protein n=1 Tax=Elysia crispata TaxID=231223 RepID=A0AAE0ZVM8_9GAST|nr:hypothetical protein RRG08_008687 [Elysia crispata]